MSDIRKYIMLLENAERLDEGLSSVLFHATSITNMERILNDNEFILSPKNKPFPHFYMSFSRNKTNGFIPYLQSLRDSDEENFDPNHDSFVVLKLDGKKLSNNYQGKQVNAFFSPDDNDDNDEAAEYREYARLNSFQEDRLLSKKQKIPNAMEYITEVHIVMTENFDPELYALLESMEEIQGAIDVKTFKNVKDYLKNKEYK